MPSNKNILNPIIIKIPNPDEAVEWFNNSMISPISKGPSLLLMYNLFGPNKFETIGHGHC